MNYAQTDVVSNGTATLTVSINSSNFNDGHWVAGVDPGSIHIPSFTLTDAGLYDPVYPEVNFINSLMAITGVPSIPITGLSTQLTGVFVGETSQFDSNTATDPTGYAKVFDNETELGPTGYIVNCNGCNLYLVGGPNGNTDRAKPTDLLMDAFPAKSVGIW